MENATAGAPKATVEQYKAYLQDLGNIGTRYTTSNGFYLSVVTALLGILSLMKPGQGLADLQDILRIAVPVFAIGLCAVWRKTLRFVDYNLTVHKLFQCFVRPASVREMGVLFAEAHQTR